MAFWKLYYHLVWATKNRGALIRPEMEDRLYGYLVQKSAEMGVYVYAVNGTSDHVHLIVAVPPKIAIADVVKRLKGASSHELNLLDGPDSMFAWQRGYGVLSLGERQRPDAEAYVRQQKAHHAQHSSNAWLEQCADLDEGPHNLGLSLTPGVTAVAELPETYDAWGEAPF